MAAGIPFAEDLNGATMESSGGCGVPNTTVTASGERVSMAGAYLRPAMTRPNLTVVLNAEVLRVLFERARAVGVEYLYEGRVLRVRAECEVVLSLGALNTPRVLMHSGVGDSQQLERHGIACRQHLPGVGRNFQDHILVAGCVWEYRRPEPPRHNSAEFTFFCKSDPALASPDLQPVLEECAFASDAVRADYPPLPSDPALAFTLAPGLVRPQSRGHLELMSNRPTEPLAVHANFLSEPEDVRALLHGRGIAVATSATPRRVESRSHDASSCPARSAGMSRCERWLRERAAGTYFHQTCTAKMGRDADVRGRRRAAGVWSVEPVANCRRVGDARHHHRQHHGPLRS